MYKTPSALQRFRAQIRTNEGKMKFLGAVATSAITAFGYGVMTENPDMMLNGAYGAMGVASTMILSKTLPNVGLKLKELFMPEALAAEREKLAHSAEQHQGDLLSIASKAHDLGIIDDKRFEQVMRVESMSDGVIKDKNRQTLNEIIIESSDDLTYQHQSALSM